LLLLLGSGARGLLRVLLDVADVQIHASRRRGAEGDRQDQPRPAAARGLRTTIDHRLLPRMLLLIN
jgi:hypothetical protein